MRTLSLVASAAFDSVVEYVESAKAVVSALARSLPYYTKRTKEANLGVVNHFGEGMVVSSIPIL